MESLDHDSQPMYVQICARVVFDGTSLTLLDLAPATFFVAQGAATSVGHLPTGVFLDHWYADSGGPGTTAVPAVLSPLHPGRAGAATVRLLLSLPRVRESGVEYEAVVLEGDVPPTSGASVLFIRPLAVPTTPVVAAHSPLAVRPSPLTT